MNSTVLYLLVLTSLALSSCGTDNYNERPKQLASAKTMGQKVQAIPVVNRPDGWDDYWYSGMAEVNTFEVTQERYGEDRPADEILVFVTEPFFPEAQVKDDGRPSKEKSISTFKLNRIEKFTTGIYDYSLMLSVFTPVSYDQYPKTLKSTFSAQDWCGHVWQQTNFRSGKYQLETRSYFQSEGDERQAIGADFLEDELVSRVRLDPNSLPKGKTKLIPAAKFSRLRHVEPKAEDAIVDFSPTSDESSLVLSITYPKLGRAVEYTFDREFPNKLLSWTESYKGRRLSKGTLKKSQQEPYWSQNSNRYQGKRAEIGL